MDYLRPVFASLYALFQPVVFPTSDPERLTQVFCGVILACFVICLAFGLWKRNALRFSQSATTVLGILGTFIGIALGLKDFDTNDIEQSVPPLLAGLKTAFLTSIFGISTSLLTRITASVMPLGSRRASEGATVQTLAELLREQIETGKENHEQALESLESIRASVSGEGDTSMLTQIQRFRTTFADKQDELIKEFRDFAENMAEANSQTLIEALEEVMRDFNSKINEQFGDNFKQLNEGVGKLVDWQDKYAQQTEAMIEQFDTTVSTIKQIRDSIAQIAERSEAITGAAEQLDPILAAIQEQRERMESYLREFADMSEKAQELLPTLDAKIRELTDNFSESVRQSISATQESLYKQNEFAQSVISGFSELDKIATGAIEQVGESSKRNIELMGAHVEDAAKRQEEFASNLAGRLHTQITETFTKTEQEIIRLAQESARNTEARLEAIDNGLGEELTKVLGEFGRELASISARFADDYGPLADRLNDVMNIIRRQDINARRP